MSAYPQIRMRRTRQNDWSRRLVRETALGVDDLIWPLFVSDSKTARTPVASMPGVDRLSVTETIKDARRAVDLGIPAIAIFPHIDPKLKNTSGSEAINPNGLVPQTVQAIKAEVPEIGVIVDVALDPYTHHGHDGILEDGEILNDPTVETLAESALVLAKAGADIVAPSDMMDGRIGAVRQILEGADFNSTMILAYAAKYASGFYGPFRDAVGSSAALTGDKRTYQMDPANRQEAIREVALDIDEGADMIMVKPALPYLDIVRDVKDAFQMPTFAYQVSGEFAMIKAAAQNGWLEEQKVVLESLLSIKRAGADGILTYFAPDVARILTAS
ncbi:MAG: porphobilinogen synthase [Hyphomonadaceae bacterium]|nr:porphobilinogen synthase [Hyphomonadaceae bacterium]